MFKKAIRNNLTAQDQKEFLILRKKLDLSWAWKKDPYNVKKKNKLYYGDFGKSLYLARSCSLGKRKFNL